MKSDIQTVRSKKAVPKGKMIIAKGGMLKLKKRKVWLYIKCLSDITGGKGLFLEMEHNPKQWVAYYSYKKSFSKVKTGDDHIKYISTRSNIKIFRSLETAEKFTEQYFTKRFGAKVSGRGK